MPDYIPQVGSIDTSGTGNDGSESEHIKELTSDDIGYGTPEFVEHTIATPETDATAMEARLDALEAASIKSVSKAFTKADMTDGTDATGYIDFATDALPVGAVVLGWAAVTTVGFSGDTSAKVMVGVAGDTDRFSADTNQSCLAPGTVGSAPLAADAWDSIGAAQTPRVTVTGGADFTSITGAAAMTVTVYYLDVL